jgi:integrase
MASVIRENRKGRIMYRVQFYDRDGKRRSIRLTDVNRRDADAIAVRVNSLVSASVAGNPPDKATLEWLADVGQELADKLAGVGLIGRRESATLAAFLDGYIASRGDAKPNTIRNLKNSRERLVTQFGADRALHTIKAGEADDWRQAMVNSGLAEATISKAVKHAKQYFKLAQRKGLIRSNPFGELKAGGERNEARKQFIDQATVEKLIDSAPDVEWKLIIALSRFGGLRCPSETLALRWGDVDWAGKRVTIQSPKTERQGKAYRVVPLFPELRKYLEAAFDAAEPGAVHCITRYRGANSNLRTQLLRIIRKAGLQPWERLFHNLRASRQTELTDEYPAHVVADWLGNTPEVADRHYLQTTEAHFRRAVAERDGVKVVQGVVQQSADRAGMDSQTQNAPLSESEALQSVAADGELVQFCTLPPRGVEPRFSD